MRWPVDLVAALDQLGLALGDQRLLARLSNSTRRALQLEIAVGQVRRLVEHDPVLAAPGTRCAARRSCTTLVRRPPRCRRRRPRSWYSPGRLPSTRARSILRFIEEHGDRVALRRGSSPASCPRAARAWYSLRALPTATRLSIVVVGEEHVDALAGEPAGLAERLRARCRGSPSRRCRAPRRARARASSVQHLERVAARRWSRRPTRAGCRAASRGSARSSNSP